MRRKSRNLLSHYYSKMLILSGAVQRAKAKALRGDHILSLYFHNPSKKEFEFVVEWLKKEAFHFISVNDLDKIIEGEAPFPKGAVLITVDDGWASNIDNMVAVANREKIPITIFLTTAAVETGNYWFSYAKQATRMGLGYPSSRNLKKWPNNDKADIIRQIREKIELPREAMTIDDVKKIASSPYITIGAHTVNHPVLPNCTDEEASYEVKQSKEIIESWIGKKVETFAYPNGDFGEREANICKEAGYKLVFANNPGFITQENLHERYKIPRIAFLEGASNEENICRIVGAWHPYSKRIFGL